MHAARNVFSFFLFLTDKTKEIAKRVYIEYYIPNTKYLYCTWYLYKINIQNVFYKILQIKNSYE